MFTKTSIVSFTSKTTNAPRIGAATTPLITTVQRRTHINRILNRNVDRRSCLRTRNGHFIYNDNYVFCRVKQQQQQQCFRTVSTTVENSIHSTQRWLSSSPTNLQQDDNDDITAAAGVVNDVDDIDNSKQHIEKLVDKVQVDITNKQPQPGRRRLSEVLISEVLKEKDSYRWVDPVISKTATVKEAIMTTIDGGLSGMIVIDTISSTSSSNSEDDINDNTVVVGLITSRDLLRIMSSGFRDGIANDTILDTLTVGEFMTPISQVIYARPDETVGMCRTIMAKLGIKCLPVLSKHGGKVEGIVTARDMSDFGLSATDKGGKQSYLNDISERVGLKADTRMMLTSRTNHNISKYNNDNSNKLSGTSSLSAHLALEQNPLYINVGIGELPHPFKTASGQSGRNRRDIRQINYTDDVSLSEDAYFVTTVQFNDSEVETSTAANTKPLTYTYMGVADGVGSWREYGIDPRNFSHALMSECENVVLEAAHAYNSTTTNNDNNNSNNPATAASNTISNTFSNMFGSRRATTNNNTNVMMRRKAPIMSPAEVMGQAYERVKEDNVIGSTTACIALFDGIRHQLHFSNLGDSGLIVLRHIDSDIAGSLKRDKSRPRIDRESDMRVAFVSQQQLRSFNHPYQLGWTGEVLSENESTSFKHPSSACTTSVHVRRGDIIILATDGLFDNVDVEDIAKVSLDWEERNGFIRHGDATQRERRWEMGNSLTVLSMERISDLANDLCTIARGNSVNTEVDSPFAILAKENDVMWSGGMPDDTTVLAVHITGRDANHIMNQPHQ